MTKLLAIARKSTLLNANYCHSIEREEARPAKLETTQPGLLESWFFGVERFGKVCISVPFNLNIESLDPQYYPDMGKLFIKLNYSPEDDNHQSDHYNNTSLAALTKLYDFEIDTADSNNLSICAKFNTMATFPATCTIQMPLNFGKKIHVTQKLKMHFYQQTMPKSKRSCKFHKYILNIVQSGGEKTVKLHKVILHYFVSYIKLHVHNSAYVQNVLIKFPTPVNLLIH